MESRKIDALILQSRNRDTDGENRYMDARGNGQGRKNREIGIDIYIIDTVYKTDDY